MAGYIPIIGMGGGSQNERPRYPFGPEFFRRQFPEYVRKACQLDNAHTVFELVISTGTSIDVSHIEEINDDYMLVVAFLDSRTCEDIYSTYVRYDMVLRINLMEERGTRSVGFNVKHEPRITAVITKPESEEAESA